MTDGHRLTVFDEHPVVGKAGNAQAWRGYFTSFPEYVIYPHKLASATAATVAILGHTAGSHLGLPDDAEARETLIWLAETTSGLVRSWTLMEDTPANRRRYALDR